MPQLFKLIQSAYATLNYKKKNIKGIRQTLPIMRVNEAITEANLFLKEHDETGIPTYNVSCKGL